MFAQRTVYIVLGVVPATQESKFYFVLQQTNAKLPHKSIYHNSLFVYSIWMIYLFIGWLVGWLTFYLFIYFIYLFVYLFIYLFIIIIMFRSD